MDLVAQSFYPDDPIPIFYPNYLQNDYRIVYILKDRIVLSIERIEANKQNQDFLQIEVYGEDYFTRLILEPMSPCSILVRGKKDFRSEEFSELNSKNFKRVTEGLDGKKVILIDTNKSWNTRIKHRLLSKDYLHTVFMNLTKPRKYEEEIMIHTDMMFQKSKSRSEIVIYPGSSNSAYIKTSKINEAECEDNNVFPLTEDPIKAIETTNKNQEQRENLERELNSQPVHSTDTNNKLTNRIVIKRRVPTPPKETPTNPQQNP